MGEYERSFSLSLEAAYLRAVRGGLSVAVVAVCLACGFAWTKYTDAVKARSPLGALLMTSQPAQRLHNFGTLGQRFSWGLLQTIGWRIGDVVGGVGLFGCVLVIGILSGGIRRAAVGLAAFLLPFFVFPTLYEVHAYYSVACGVFLIFAVAMTLE